MNAGFQARNADFYTISVGFAPFLSFCYLLQMLTKKILLLLVFSLGISGRGYATGKDLVEAGFLTQAAWDALMAAKDSGGYKIKLLTRGEENNPQIVVLAGEEHVKSQAHAALGKSLLDQFPYRGLEGVSTDWSLPTWFFIKIAKVCQWCLKHSGQNTPCGSTLHVATAQEGFCPAPDAKQLSLLSKQCIAFYKQRVAALVQFLKERDSSASSSSDPSAVVADFCTWDIQSGLQKIQISLQDVMDHLDQTDLLFQSGAPHPMNFLLEANHQPSFAEKFGYMSYSLNQCALMAGICSLPLRACSAISNSTFAYVAVPALALGAYQYLWGRSLQQAIESERETPIWFVPQHSLISNRDKTMVSNLRLLLNDFPEIRSILVVVGKAHVSGIARLLKQDSFE